MKPYVVIKWKEPSSFDGLGRRTIGDSGMYYVPTTEKYNPYDDGEFDGQIYFTDSRNDADTLVTTLLKHNPFGSYLIAESRIMFQTKPGPVVRSLFTADGFIPE